MSQNSGVMVFADGRNYYGKCIEIIELNYYERFCVIMLRCDLVNIKSPRRMKKDANGFIMVKFSELIHTGNRDSDNPYILASQSKQVFYVKDGKNERWLHVIGIKPRDLFNLSVETPVKDDEYLQSSGILNDVRASSWLDAMKSSSPRHTSTRGYNHEIVSVDTDVAYRTWMAKYPSALSSFE
ncbi:hypothetical protein PVK06_011201 [Gossypium arboreum]|uniref:DUF4216 domain-containing protein n=1 Tax=Gossypium arboreum TaxID=29729 RepID=A0ABR0Q849_GOSAR|nr:hypothetical protein PVK06_011201 [Gossypium arboreum]